MTEKTDDNISKSQLINYLNKKLEDNPIDNYNESVRNWSRGYRRAFLDFLQWLK